MEEKAELKAAIQQVVDDWQYIAHTQGVELGVPGVYAASLVNDLVHALSPHGKGVVEQDHGSARDRAQATGGSCEDGLLAVVGNREDGFSVMAGVREALEPFAHLYNHGHVPAGKTVHLKALDGAWWATIETEAFARAALVLAALSLPTPEGGEAVARGFVDAEPTSRMIDAGLEYNHRHNSAENMVASFKAMLAQAEIDGLIYATPSGEIAGLREALDEARTVLTTLCARYGYHDDGITMKDWSEWVEARRVKHLISERLGNAPLASPPISLGLAMIEDDRALEAINPTSVEGG